MSRNVAACCENRPLIDSRGGVRAVKIRTASSDDFIAILSLQKGAKHTVGFLSDQAVRERLDRGTILVAESDDQSIVGYLMYDLPRHEVSIKQLAIEPWARLGGVAEQLVTYLVTMLEGQRQWVGLKCRRDYELRRFWERLGFAPYSEVRGRASAGSVLTLWRRELGYPDLFSAAAEADLRPLAVLDTNLVIRGASGDAEVRDKLMAEWVQAEVRFAVVVHTYTEIDKRDDKADRDRHKRYADGIGRESGGRDGALRIEAEITAELGEGASRFRDDVTIAAQAAAAGARWLVTEDHRFRSRCGDAVARIAEVDVVSVADFLTAVDFASAGDGYRPAELMGTDVAVRLAEPGEFDVLARTFVNQRAGETFTGFRATLHALAAQVPETHIYVFESEQEFLALAAIRSGPVLDAPVCRVRRGPYEPTLARQLLGWLRSQVTEQGAHAIRVTDRAPGRWVDAGLSAEGFLNHEYPLAVPVAGLGTFTNLADHLAAEPLGSLIGPAQLEDIRRLEPEEGAAHAVEGTFHPYWVVGASLRTYRVPIRDRYAAELFDHSLSDDQLFPRDRTLALRREHVYFRAPTGRLDAPARILWYVTGKRPGTLRGTSLLNEVVVGDVDQILARFAHLGVLDAAQVRERSKDGRIMALRFSHTTLFPSPVGHGQYLEVMSELIPDRQPFWAAPEIVPEQVFVQVATMAR